MAKKPNDAAHQLKSRRLQWIEMIIQLRFGSPTTPHIEPGECQTFLDFLVEREWPFEKPAPQPRFWNHTLKKEKATVNNLFQLIPNWLQVERMPKSDDGLPIFYRARDQLFYIDGRRRLSKLFKQNPEKEIQFWVLAKDKKPLDPFIKKAVK